MTTFFNEFHGFTGDCGEYALEHAYAMSSRREASVDSMNAIVRDMQAHNEAGANGISWIATLAEKARRDGYTVALEWDYSEPFPHDWHQVLLDNAGKRPVILQFAQAHNLHDQETGAADEPQVFYHYACALLSQADGYVCADGDNPQATGRYQVYSFADLQSAVPCGLLMLEMQEVTTVTDPKLGSGEELYREQHPELGNDLSGEQNINGTIVAAFEHGIVPWFEGKARPDLAGYALTSIVEYVRSLESEVAALKNAKPAPAPAPTIDPAAVELLLTSIINLTVPFASLNVTATELLKKVA